MSETHVGSGNINTESINNTHSQIRSIVELYGKVNKEVRELAITLEENWVGVGRNEFESQFNQLSTKMTDIGDILEEIYDALVLAEAKYESSDDSLRQKFTKSISESKE